MLFIANIVIISINEKQEQKMRVKGQEQRKEQLTGRSFFLKFTRLTRCTPKLGVLQVLAVAFGASAEKESFRKQSQARQWQKEDDQREEGFASRKGLP